MEFSKQHARFDAVADDSGAPLLRFISAAPFMFLLVAGIVLAFGPGAFSLDQMIFGKTRTE